MNLPKKGLLSYDDPILKYWREAHDLINIFLLNYCVIGKKAHQV